MKSYSSTISVNPSTMSVGEKNFKAMSALEESMFSANKTLRTSFADSYEEGSNLMPLILKSILGVSGKPDGLSAPMDALTLITRIGFGLFVIVLSAVGLTGVSSILLAITGAMVVCGFMTRISLTTLVITLMTAASSLQLAPADNTYTIAAGIGLVLAIAGPGHTSMDAIAGNKLSQYLDIYMKRTARIRRDSYRAYEYAD